MSVREAAPGAGADEVLRWLDERGLDHAGLDVAVVDALRPGLAALVSDADVVVVTRGDVASVASLTAVGAMLDGARVVPVATPAELEHGPPLLDAAVVVVEDGAATTEGGLPFGAATQAASAAYVGMRIDPRPYAVGAVAEAYERYPHLTSIVPAVEPIADVEATLDAIDCDAVISASPLPIRTRHPLRRAWFTVSDPGGALERALVAARADLEVPA